MATREDSDETMTLIFSCMACGGDFTSRDDLVAHMISAHTRTVRKLTEKPSSPSEAECDIFIEEEQPDTSSSEDEPVRKKIRKSNRKRERSTTVVEPSIGKSMVVPEPKTKASRKKQTSSESSRTSSEKKQFSCKVCRENMSDLAECREHSKKHARNEYCAICDREILSSVRRANHILIHMGIKEFICILCGKSFAFDYDLRKHAWSAHFRANCCGMCGGKFDNKDELREHFDEKHKTVQMIRIEEREKRRQATIMAENVAASTPRKDDNKLTSEAVVRVERMVEAPESFTVEALVRSDTTEQTMEEVRVEHPVTGNMVSIEIVTDFDDQPSSSEMTEADLPPEHNAESAEPPAPESSNDADKPFSCELCETRFSTKAARDRHWKEQHLGYRNYKCECNALFYRKTNLDGHRLRLGHVKYEEIEDGVSVPVESDVGWRKWVVASSNKKDGRPGTSGLDEPEVSEDGVPVKKRTVDKQSCKCGCVYTTQSALRRHVDEFHLKIKNYRCECGEEFYLKTHVDLHRKYAKHENMTLEKLTVRSSEEIKSAIIQVKKSIENETKSVEVMCDICGDLLPNEKSLSRHQSLHETKDSLHHCPYCNEIFKLPIKLKAHLKTHSSNVFFCDLCNAGITSLPELREHNQLVHFDVGNPHYMCEICCRQYNSQQALYAHKVKHNKTKSFACDLCDKSFYLRSQLNRHYSDVHLNIRPYNCGMCEKTFSRKHHLENHMTTHTDDRPVPCNLCDSAFKTKDHLDQHLKRVHGILRKKGLNLGEIDDTSTEAATFTITDCTIDETIEAETMETMDSVLYELQTTDVCSDVINGVCDDVTDLYRCSECAACFLDLRMLKVHYVEEHEEVVVSWDFDEPSMS